jgi:hypothetical protein
VAQFGSSDPLDGTEDLGGERGQRGSTQTTKAVADADHGIADQAVFRGIARSGSGHERPRRAIAIDAMPYFVYINTKFATTESNSVSDEIVPPPPALGRRRLFQPGQSGNPAGRAAGLTKQGGARRGEFARWRSPGVDPPTAVACGEITPGEAAAIAGVYETVVRTAGIAKEKVAQTNLLRILTAGDDVEDGKRKSAMPKPSTIATRGRRRPTAAGETVRRRALIQP